MKKTRPEKSETRTLRPLTREEQRSVMGGTVAPDSGGLLAFPFIQQAM